MLDENIFEDQEMVEAFLIEADEITEQLNDDLVTLEAQPDDLELRNAIFRSFHTLRGMAGFLGFTQLVQLAHESENVLDRLRNRELNVTPELMDISLESVDLTKVLLEEVRSQEIQPHNLSEIFAKIRALIEGGSTDTTAVEQSEEEAVEEFPPAAPEAEGVTLPSLEWLQQQAGIETSASSAEAEKAPVIEDALDAEVSGILEDIDDSASEPASASADSQTIYDLVYALRNENEEPVIDLVYQYKAEGRLPCDCRECVLAITTLTLDALQPRYCVSGVQVLHPSDEDELKFNTDLKQAIEDGCEIVKARPPHSGGC